MILLATERGTERERERGRECTRLESCWNPAVSLPLTRRLFLSLFPRKFLLGRSGCATTVLQVVVIVDNQILRLNTRFNVNGNLEGGRGRGGGHAKG